MLKLIGLTFFVIATAGVCFAFHRASNALIAEAEGRSEPATATAKAKAAAKPSPKEKTQAAEIARIQAAEALEWNRRMLVGSYDRVGRKNPLWDKPAREALEIQARYVSRQADPEPRVEDAHAAAARAVAAGCDDPLVLHIYAQTSRGPNDPGREEVARRYRASAKAALIDSGHPFYRRAMALVFAGAFLARGPSADDDTRAEAGSLLDKGLDLLAQSMAKEERCPAIEAEWEEIADDTLAAFVGVTGSLKSAFERVDAKLANPAVPPAFRLRAKANFLISYGWEARGAGLAKTVTRQGWKKFDERLTEARAALEESWKLDPNNPRTATAMIVIEMAIGKGDRDAMETWFRRATEAGGGDPSAYSKKLLWLAPKWRGSEAEVLAFGRECRDSGDWRNGRTLLLGDAHILVLERFDGQGQWEYLKPPARWIEIRSVYEDYFCHRPNDHLTRTRFALLCYMGGRYKLAHRQFEILGAHAVPHGGFSADYVKEAREISAREAQKTTARASQAKPPLGD